MPCSRLFTVYLAGSPNDETLIDAKWESLTLAPVGDPAFPDDFFLFTAVRASSPPFHAITLLREMFQSDNDFISTNGVSLGEPFDAGLDVDNQFLVFRLTLPGASNAR